MGVRVNRYGREMDKSKKGESLQERHNKAVKASEVKSEPVKKKNEEDLVAKTKRRMKELWHGEKTYLPGHKKPEAQQEQKDEMKKTFRTVQTIRGLRAAGLTEKDYAKFMPKGKK